MKKLLCTFFMICASLAQGGEVIKCPAGSVYNSKEEKGWKFIGCLKTMEDGREVAHGPYISIYPNGQVSLESNYVDGKEDGPYKVHHENGKIKKIGTNKNGNPTGPITEFYSNGMKNSEGEYRDGAPAGTWSVWDKKGKVLAKGLFADVIKTYKAYLKKLDEEENGTPLTASVFTPCYSEQITSLKTGKPMKETWIPRKGITFRADDQFYTIRTVLSNNPTQLLLEGPTQIDESLKNACYVVLTVKNPSLLKAESTGKELTVGDSVHGFELKSIGATKIGLQRLKDISKTDLILPNFELLTTFGSAQGK